MEKYTRSTVPFTLVRLVVGVSAKVDDRAVVERKAVLNEQHHPLDIDIWDQSRISEMLRDKPEIVIKYFGPRAAERFCVPHVLVPVEIPSLGAVATADAVLLGPLISTDAQRLVDRANDIANYDPDAALALYREVQSRLAGSGFPGHAAEFDDTVVALSIRTGQAETAIRPLMDALWAAEGKGDSLGVDRVVRRLRDLADLPEFGPTHNKVPRTPRLGAAFEIADFVSDQMHTPIPARIEMPADATTLADRGDRARAIVFAAEGALGNDDLTWIVEHREQIESTASDVDVSDIELAVRLRLVIADATGEWADLVRHR